GRKSAVTKAIEHYGLGDSVRFETGIDKLRLVELYAEAEIAVVPSLYEGFSLPAIEAMSCRVPVIATTAGALPEVIGGAGIMVPPSDAGALASAIMRLLENKSRRVELGSDGRRRVLERFTWRAAAEKTTAVYERAISDHG
ncbi:MAG TPA: glycosyltransferase, partial [Actinomycetota bacterium]|nr:glycosyltransferase [Actinomycetota bacterium]